MQAAVVSDIHGNLPALEAVLEDIPDTVDRIWCLGDIVGYNPWPSECVTLVRERADVVVQGNHDRRVGSRSDSLEDLSNSAQKSVTWVNEQLGTENKPFLADLPEQKMVGNGRVLLTHSDPRRVDGYVFPAEFRNLNRFLDDRSELRVLALGHTHISHVELVEETLVMNPGSVGQPRDGDPRASYAVVDLSTDPDGTNVEMRRVEYDVDSVIDRIQSVGLPSEFGERLRTGT